MIAMPMMGVPGTAAWLTIGHDHEDGTVSWTLECPHGATRVTERIMLGGRFPDEPSLAVLQGQAGIHERVLGCGDATRFLLIQYVLTDGRRPDA